MNVKHGIAVVVSLILCPSCVLADTVVLKSGKQVEGTITEETKEYIAIEHQGSPIYYERKYIARIDKTSSGAEKPAAAAASATQGGQAAAVQEDDRGFLARGLDAGIAGRFDEAAAALREGLKKFADDDQMAGALEIIEKVTEGKVSSAFAVNMFQGFKYALLSDYAQATRFLQEAYKLDPDDTDLNYNLGIIAYELEDYAGALKYLQKVSGAEPDSGEVYGRIGNAYYMLGDFDRAQENLMIAMMLFRKAGDSDTAGQIGAVLDELRVESDKAGVRK